MSIHKLLSEIISHLLKERVHSPEEVEWGSSHEPWLPTTTSYAWISPTGELIKISNSTDHEDSANEIIKSRSELASLITQAHYSDGDFLKEKGWLGYRNIWEITFYDRQQMSNSAIVKRIVDIVISCVRDPEGNDFIKKMMDRNKEVAIFIAQPYSYANISLPDFVHKYGTSQQEDEFWLALEQITEISSIASGAITGYTETVGKEPSILDANRKKKKKKKA